MDQKLGDALRESPHFKEGVAAFLEKRKPVYEWILCEKFREAFGYGFPVVVNGNSSAETKRIATHLYRRGTRGQRQSALRIAFSTGAMTAAKASSRRSSGMPVTKFARFPDVTHIPTQSPPAPRWSPVLTISFKRRGRSENHLDPWCPNLPCGDIRPHRAVSGFLQFVQITFGQCPAPAPLHFTRRQTVSVSLSTILISTPSSAGPDD